jgi:hypothetical protein
MYPMKQSTKYSPMSVHLAKKQNVLLNERELLDVEIRQVESELEELLVELARLHVLHLLEGRLANQVQAGGNVFGRTDADNIGLNKNKIYFLLVSLIIRNTNTSRKKSKQMPIKSV